MNKADLKQFFVPVQQGVNLVTQSFRFLFEHPILFSYYAVLVFIQTLLFVLIYNLLGQRLPFFEMAHELNITVSHTHETPALHEQALFLYLICSIAWSIFLRNFASVALVAHAHRLLNGQEASVKQALKDTHAKWKKISLWSLFVLAISTGAQLFGFISVSMATFLFVFFGLIIWAILSCFVLVSIAIESISLKQSLLSSIDCVVKKARELLGCASWIAIVYLLAMAIMSLLGSLVSKQIFIPLSYALFFALNGVVSQALLIFKTKLYDRYLFEKVELFKDESNIDFSQF